MTRKTIGCVECGEKVPYGRLSCPACGALLASVAGGRGQGRAATSVALSEPFEPNAPEPNAPEPAEPVDERVYPVPVVEPVEAVPSAEVAAAGAQLVPSPWAPMSDRREPVLSPRPYRVPGTGHPADAYDPYDRSATPGAYRPPSMMLATAGSAALQPAWPHARTAALGAKGVPGGKAADDPSSVADDDAEATDAGRFVEIADWFVIVGASLAVLGFLLPWSATVIGSSGFGSYFDDWGLASPTHLVILLGLLVILALGVLETPVPAWLGTGVFGLLLGGLLLGLVWPYLVGPLGADVGALIVAAGGLALVIGGALASRATRHDEADPPV